MIYTSVTQLIGGTPLLELTNIEKKDHLYARVLAKIEGSNPAGSAKDRVALNMILDAEEKGILTPGELGMSGCIAKAEELKKQIQLSDPYAVTRLCRQILFYLKGNYPHDVSEHLLQVLLAEIVAQGRESELSTEALAVRIREWIRINTDQPLTVSQIANRFGYNEDYLSRLFKKNYGKSLKGVIDEMKAAQIKRLLLESDMTLYEIARRMSFEDYKLFLKFFKYHEGITPTEFRNLYCDIHTNNH